MINKKWISNGVLMLLLIVWIRNTCQLVAKWSQWILLIGFRSFSPKHIPEKNKRNKTWKSNKNKKEENTRERERKKKSLAQHPLSLSSFLSLSLPSKSGEG